MRLSYQWLKQYLHLNVPVKQLAEKIERTSVEYDDIIQPKRGLKKLVVGKVVSMKKHPNADHLTICQVDVGAGQPVQIICGAPNVAVGKKVIVALHGARVAGNVKIKRAKMRGVRSNGMLCALDEIGFDKAVIPKKWQPGIYFLPDNAKVGKPVYSYLGMDDQIIDLDVTPNRGDMLSMKGIVHQLAANYNLQIHWSAPQVKEATSLSAASEIHSQADSKIAPIYKLRVLNHIKVQASPLWLQIRLWNCGIQPVNNVVDATNYIMLKYGQPIHAFDLDRLTDQTLNVRRANQGEKLVNADHKTIKLNPYDIVIADGQSPVAMAGVTGSIKADVTDRTQNIVLEAGVFNPVLVRKMAQRHSIHTQSSQRFERGVDHGGVDEALDDAAQLTGQIAKGQVASGIVNVNNPRVTPVTIKVTVDHINSVLGTRLSKTSMVSIFRRLGFTVNSHANQLSVTVPTRRWDIKIVPDLCEEVAKLYGYDKLPSTLPKGPATHGELTSRQQLLRKSRAILEASGLSHAISYSLTTTKKAQLFMTRRGYATHLLLPMSIDHSTLRMNLISGLLDDIAYNQARSVKNVALFEQGRVFYRFKPQQQKPTEMIHVAGAVSGSLVPEAWNQKARSVDFYQLKGILNNYLKKMDVQGPIKYIATDQYSEMHPGRTAKVYINDNLVGFIGQIHPVMAKRFQIDPTYVFELDLDKIIKWSALTPATQVPKYPSINRDVALLLDNNITNAQVLRVIQQNGGRYLHRIKLFDVYEGGHIPTGKKSMAYTLVYLDPRGTLVDKTVDKAVQKVQKALENQLDAKIR